MKSFSDLRQKVHEIDVGNRFSDLLISTSEYKIKANILNKVNELDKQIESAELNLVRCLNNPKDY
jgi:hypothetical protein